MRNIVTYLEGKMIIAMDVSLTHADGKVRKTLVVYYEGLEPWVFLNHTVLEFPCVQAFIQWYTTDPSAEDRKNSGELRDYALDQNGIYR